MADLILILVILFIVALGTAISIFFVKRETQKLSQLGETPALKLIKEDIEVMRKRVEDGYGKIAFQLGRIQEIGRAMRDFQDFLKSPKLRGGIGEQILRDLLEQVLPKQSFKIQHQFREGQIVDAIIKTKQGIIPIDSKFPMEVFAKIHKAKEDEKEKYLREFVRAIKKHIDSISRKYILPQEGTVDFALMYIPAEAIYYEIMFNLTEEDLARYAWKQKVALTSPNTIYLTLRTIEHWFRDTQISKRTQQILKRLERINRDAQNLSEEFRKLGRHLKDASSAYDRSERRLSLLDERVKTLIEARDKKQLKSGSPPLPNDN